MCVLIFYIRPCIDNKQKEERDVASVLAQRECKWCKNDQDASKDNLVIVSSILQLFIGLRILCPEKLFVGRIDK